MTYKPEKIAISLRPRIVNRPQQICDVARSWICCYGLLMGNAIYEGKVMTILRTHTHYRPCTKILCMYHTYTRAKTKASTSLKILILIISLTPLAPSSKTVWSMVRSSSCEVSMCRVKQGVREIK